MAGGKKISKEKCISEDDGRESMSGYNQPNKKKTGDLISRETCQKIVHLFHHQLEERKQSNEDLLEKLAEIGNQIEAEYNVMKENEQKLGHLTTSYLKCIQQSTTAYEQKLRDLDKIHTEFKNKVEGLLVRGALKPDDRPLWFDVYRAFPPLVEPKFARTKPEIKPIRQIFYHEDVVRAKFHSKGHGTGPVNLLAQSNDTQTKRLVSQYEKLKSEGVPEDELVEKSATAVGIERKEQYEAATKTKSTTPTPGSVTAQLFSDTDLKNIFKE